MKDLILMLFNLSEDNLHKVYVFTKTLLEIEKEKAE